MTASSAIFFDPNLPNTVPTIQYSAAGSAFSQYCNGHCYDGIIYNGDGALNLSEPYTNIFNDAQNNFSNSGGAGGAYYIDTTTLANGTHQIGWYVVDDCNRAEGIGSRLILSNVPSEASAQSSVLEVESDE